MTWVQSTHPVLILALILALSLAIVVAWCLDWYLALIGILRLLLKVRVVTLVAELRLPALVHAARSSCRIASWWGLVWRPTILRLLRLLRLLCMLWLQPLRLWIRLEALVLLRHGSETATFAFAQQLRNTERTALFVLMNKLPNLHSL